MQAGQDWTEDSHSQSGRDDQTVAEFPRSDAETSEKKKCCGEDGVEVLTLVTHWYGVETAVNSVWQSVHILGLWGIEAKHKQNDISI